MYNETISYLFWGEAGRSPCVTSFEGFVFVNDQVRVIRSLPSQSIANVDKVIMVDVMNFPRALAVLTRAPKYMILNVNSLECQGKHHNDKFYICIIIF